MKSNFLDKIVAHKTAEVAAASRRIPVNELRAEAEKRRDQRPFADKLRQPGKSGANIVAEIKRASPSKGLIRPDLDVVQYAKAYTRGGAAALSVLTDESFFQGSLADLKQARAATTLPVLRKDFLISTYQLYEAAAAGADAILLIVRILAPRQLQDFLALARELGLDALVEVHSQADVEAADKAGADLIGINNRNLQTFETDIRLAQRLADLLSPAQTAIAASGINNRADIEENLKVGIFNFLIGESLVRAQNPTLFLRSLRGCDG